MLLRWWKTYEKLIPGFLSLHRKAGSSAVRRTTNIQFTKVWTGVSKRFSLSIVGMVLVSLISEALLILTIHVFSPISAITLFSLFFSIFCFFVVWLFENEKKDRGSLIGKLEKWISFRTNELTKKKRQVLKYGMLIGVLTINIFSGPIIATIFSLTLQINNSRIYLLIFVYNFVFFLVWTLVYSGGLKIIGSLWH